MKILKKPNWILTSFLIIVPFLLFGLVNWYQNKFDHLPVYGAGSKNASGQIFLHEVDNFNMINQNDQVITLENLKDKILVANFFFTSCPGVCSNMMDHMKKVQLAFPSDAQLSFISFTVDPSRDQSARLKWYEEKHQIDNRNWSLLTGDKKEIYRLARKSFYLSAAEGDGGTNDFIHSDQLVLIDKKKHIRGYYEGTSDQSTEKLIQDIKKLENEN
ncbi:MAG: SCO family protein [Chitinophagales bacterium]